MKIRTGVFALLFLSLLTPSRGFSAPAKMDGALAIISQTGVVPASSKALKSISPGQGPYVAALVKFQGSLSGVEALGGHVRSVIGDIASVDIPVGALSRTAALANVVYIESAKRVKRRLDVSVPETGATQLRSGTPPNWTGATGKGVVIGIIDSGIDVNHKDFTDASGNTRILYLWDQATSGTPPSGYNYGNECTKASIDAGHCTETDTDGHGTSVAGIAAGNGSAGPTPYKYVGMAPEADIIAVNSLNSGVTLTTTTVTDAISYIQSRAASLNEPSVINLSFGGHVDPHDGTSLFEQIIDNASGAGKVLVCAAGNEATAAIHASGTVATGSSATVGFDVPPSGTGSQDLDLWYAGADQMAISFNFNGTCSTAPVYRGSIQTFNTPCGNIMVSNAAGGVDPFNGDNEIQVFFSYNGTTPISSGTWSFTLTGVSVSTQGRFDVWMDDTVTSNATFTDHVDQSVTLDDCGTATDSLSVGAYTTKEFWTSINGGTYSLLYPDPIGSIGSFSSHGPRRTCSLAANCPAVQKPDITAPGEVIMTSYSSQTSPAADPRTIDPDGVHLMEAGTSMSAPHVTGAVALILEKSPTLTYDAVKNVLTSSAKTDSYTGPVPNNTWGYGKLDVAAAFGVSPPSVKSGGGGCFIATAAYGSYLEPHVVVLREFRDRYLLTNGPGRELVALYYRYSPPAADFIRRHEALRVLTRLALTPIVYSVEYPGAALAVVCLGAIVFIPLGSRIRRRKP